MNSNSSKSKTGTRQKKKILFLIQKLIAGGCERQIIEVMDGINHDLYTPILGCLEKGGIYTKLVESKNIPIVYFERKFRWDISPVWGIANYAKKNNISFIHSYLALPGFYATFAGKLARVPTITSSIAGPTQRASRFLIRLSKFSDIMLPNTEAGLRYFFPKKLPKNYIIIPTGVNTERLNPDIDVAEKLSSIGMDNYTFIVGWVAGLKVSKDPITFLKAAKIIAETREDIGFIIVGNGPKHKEVVTYIKENDLSNRVIPLTDRGDVEELLKVFNIFVLASSPIHGEGISLAVAEAMASYLPVIATNSGATKEIVKNNHSGFIVPNLDYKGIAEKILYFYDNPEILKQFGQRSREIIEQRFSLPVIADQIEKVYEMFLEKQK